jgi:glyoxylate reductase|tara:strand:- start:56 stop:1018 length:963 start_codon:yes stop_codon:yes gene_type:complete
MPSQKKILITRRLPDAVTNRAQGTYEATLNNEDVPYGVDQMIELAQDKDAVLCTLTNDMSRGVIERLPDSIHAIATFSVGYEHIDLEAAKERGIIVTNTPGVLTEATADVTLLLILGASRRAREGAEMISGDWNGWTPTQLMGLSMQTKRLGILGMGDIGRACALRARAFGMEIHYHNRTRLSLELEKGATYHDSPEELLKVSDFLSLHCPLAADTKYFLNEERIALLPHNSVVINTARGPIIDDEALIAALKSGRVAAAGLDVFDGEPKLNPGYKDCKNAFLLPHLGSATVETRNAMGFTALDNLDAVFAGKEPPNKLV